MAERDAARRAGPARQRPDPAGKAVRPPPAATSNPPSAPWAGGGGPAAAGLPAGGAGLGGWSCRRAAPGEAPLSLPPPPKMARAAARPAAPLSRGGRGKPARRPRHSVPRGVTPLPLARPGASRCADGGPYRSGGGRRRGAGADALYSPPVRTPRGAAGRRAAGAAGRRAGTPPGPG